MTGTLTLLRFELRRHLPLLLAGWMGVALLPLIHRVATGGWGYRSSWGEAGALFTVAVATPLLALALSLRTWADERASGTLLWLYAQPLSAAAIFWVRAGAVALAAVAFLAGAAAYHLGRLAGLAPWLAPSLFLAALCAAGGLCASAVAASPGGSVRGLLAGGAVLAGVAVLQWLPPWESGLWRREALVALAGAQSALWTLALLLGAWGAVRVAPADSRRCRRALRLAVVPLILGLTPGMVPRLAAPSRLGDAAVVGGGDLGGGSRLEIIQTPAMHPLTVVPRVVRPDGAVVTVERTVPARYADAFISADAGRAVLVDMGTTARRDDARWFLVDRSGDVDAGFLPPELDSARLRPVGWSPGGGSFAWLDASGAELILLAEDLGVRRVDLPPGAAWEARWLDHRRLSLAARERRGAARHEVVDLGGG